MSKYEIRFLRRMYAFSEYVYVTASGFIFVVIHGKKESPWKVI